MQARVAGIACEVPDRVVTNQELAAENPTWDVARAERKIGIKSRRITEPHQCASDLAFRAADRLLSLFDLDRKDVDALIFCTQSPDHFLPATACSLQHRLGISTSCASFDINQGCSGYVYGLYLAKALVESGMACRVLLLTGETYSKYINPGDRTNRLLFGDAGSATLVDSVGGGATIGEFVLGTDGSGFSHLIVPAGGMRMPKNENTAVVHTDPNGSTRSLENLFMDGQEVFAFTLRRVPEMVGDLLKRTGMTKDQVDWYVFHQANAFMNEALRNKLEIPSSKYPICLERYGNTVSNTIPITITEMGTAFNAGERVLLAGFGVGYSWGACLLEWGEVQLLSTRYESEAYLLEH